MTNIVHKQQSYHVKMYMVKNRTNKLLSGPTASVMGLVLYAGEDHASIFSDRGCLWCSPVKIQLQDDAVPYSVSTSRCLSAPLLPKIEAELKWMENNGVIHRVTELTLWCASMVPVFKKSGDVRICVDLKQLNKTVSREKIQIRGVMS